VLPFHLGLEPGAPRRVFGKSRGRRPHTVRHRLARHHHAGHTHDGQADDQSHDQAASDATVPPTTHGSTTLVSGEPELVGTTSTYGTLNAFGR
jgi:hypothetical protein